MTSEIGMAQSAMRYAANHKLPITFVIEDNQISVIPYGEIIHGVDHNIILKEQKYKLISTKNFRGMTLENWSKN